MDAKLLLMGREWNNGIDVCYCTRVTNTSGEDWTDRDSAGNCVSSGAENLRKMEPIVQVGVDVVVVISSQRQHWPLLSIDFELMSRCNCDVGVGWRVLKGV